MMIQVLETGEGPSVAVLAVEAPNVGGGSPDSVGDAGPDVILDPLPLPKEKRSVQIENLAFGDVPFVAERGNRLVSLSFTVQSFFSTRDLAQAWVLGASGAGDAVPPGANYDLVITSDDGDSVSVYANGALSGVEVVFWVNTTCAVRWNWEGLTPP